MTARSDTGSSEPAKAPDREWAQAPAPSRTATKTERYTQAARRMQRGKQLVMIGFAVAVTGVVVYALACLGADVNQDVGVSFLSNSRWLVGPALGAVGFGTLLWLLGSFAYFSGAMDGDPNGPDLYY